MSFLLEQSVRSNLRADGSLKAKTFFGKVRLLRFWKPLISTKHRLQAACPSTARRWKFTRARVTGSRLHRHSRQLINLVRTWGIFSPASEISAFYCSVSLCSLSSRWGGFRFLWWCDVSRLGGEPLTEPCSDRAPRFPPDGRSARLCSVRAQESCFTLVCSQEATIDQNRLFLIDLGFWVDSIVWFWPQFDWFWFPLDVVWDSLEKRV